MKVFSKLLFFCLLILLGFSLGHAEGSETCWKDSYGRGVGTIPGDCDLHQSRQGLFCYKKCKVGYDGVLNVCWQKCPKGSRNDGAFCRYSEYGRGAGFPWKFGDSLDDSSMFKRCERKHGRGRCEKHGAIVYPKCKKGYKAFGCCICRPKKVDCSGMAGKFDLSCAKKTYTRTTYTAKCGGGKESDAGLCYPKCKPGYNGVGPVCWGTCPASHPVNCGASCAKTTAACVEATTDQVVSVLDVAANVAITVGTLGTGTGAKVAASTTAKAAKVGAKKGAKIAAKQSLKAAAKQGLKKAGRKMSRSEIRQSLQKAKQSAIKKGGRAKEEALKMNREKLEKMVDLLDKAQGVAEASEDGLDPMEIAEIMDPTGVVAIVNAYNNPICSAPNVSPAVARSGGSSFNSGLSGSGAGGSGSSSSRFTPPPTSAGTHVGSQSGVGTLRGFQRIQNRWKSSEYVHNQNGSAVSGGIKPGWWSAQWKIVPVQGTAFIRIQNRWKPSEYLHNQNGRLESGAIKPGWWSAQWKLIQVPGTIFKRIQNRWKPAEHIHNQNGRLESGAIQPGWWSAQWVIASNTKPVNGK